MSIYRKRGSVVRYEQGVVVRVDEAGEAREIGAELIAEPLNTSVTSGSDSSVSLWTGTDGEGSPARVREQALAVRAMAVRYGVALERIVISEGVADHEYGARRWRETQRRMHISLTHGSNRALLDFADFELDAVAHVAQALARCQSAGLGSAGHRDRRAQTLRLAPNVAAALLPSLTGSIELEQMPAGHDGYGQPVALRHVVAGELPPNWYRPSYRIRPVRAWHNVRAVPFGSIALGSIGESAPRAIALLAPPGHGVLRVLCVEGQDAFAATVEVTSIRAAGESGAWYPYAAGAFGAEMLL